MLTYYNLIERIEILSNSFSVDIGMVISFIVNIFWFFSVFNNQIKRNNSSYFF